MQIVTKLLFAALSLCIVLALGMLSEPAPSPVASNPMKSNQQQYDRVHEAPLMAKQTGTVAEGK
ncbi:hypothetical protein ACFQ88_08640 [Paenibacillus sp. NPDC056579]|uniref:hypothetical protein n=1 Tax=Paenibacillus sp. NPDC056579 TaxID=3345871 RepID=UPI003681DC88